MYDLYGKKRLHWSLQKLSRYTVDIQRSAMTMKDTCSRSADTEKFADVLIHKHTKGPTVTVMAKVFLMIPAFLLYPSNLEIKGEYRNHTIDVIKYTTLCRSKYSPS